MACEHGFEDHLVLDQGPEGLRHSGYQPEGLSDDLVPLLGICEEIIRVNGLTQAVVVQAQRKSYSRFSEP